MVEYAGDIETALSHYGVEQNSAHWISKNDDYSKFLISEIYLQNSSKEATDNFLW